MRMWRQEVKNYARKIALSWEYDKYERNFKSRSINVNNWRFELLQREQIIINNNKLI